MHCIRYEIAAPRKHFPDRADVQGNMLNAVDNRAVGLTEDNIAVFAHQFHDEKLGAQIAQFIQVFNLKF